MSEKKLTITFLFQVKYLEEAEAELSQKVTELEGANHMLKQRLDVKDELLADVQLVETLTNQVKALQAENNALESKVIDLEENNDVLKDNWRKVADEEADRRECLQEKIKLLECTNSDLKAKLKDQEVDLDLSTPSIASEINEDLIQQLNERISELEMELASVKEQNGVSVNDLENEICRLREKEHGLLNAVNEMEKSESQMKIQIENLKQSEKTLSETVANNASFEQKLSEMEKHEDDLREEFAEKERAFEKKVKLMSREIAELHQQEDDLCTRIEELEENEVALQDKLDKLKEAEMNYKNKIEELENRETSLTIQFSKRFEEMEHQEQETAKKLNSRIAELEENEHTLKSEVKQLLSDKESLTEKISILEKHEKESSEKHLHHIDECFEQENVALLKADMSTLNSQTVTLQNRYEGVAKLETESSKSISNGKQSGSSENCATSMDNQTLLEEIAKLKAELMDSVKEQKSLEDKLKRQEKKRKRSERSEKSDDYDSIAREVVTYKLEVEQLRSENNDLHERIMELDESEKSLQELNEQLVSEVNVLKKLKEDCELSSAREQELVNRINELEEIHHSSRAETNTGSMEQSGDNKKTHAGGEHISLDQEDKETETDVVDMIDEKVGTCDFMEGVMPGQDQGKPVSSMFERIQKLENENQDLSARLSTLTATDAQVRQLSEKVKALEENEDSLMERVMELEEEEDRLKRELSKAKSSVHSVDDLEEEIATLHEKEDGLNSTIEGLNNTIEGLKLENVTLKKTMDSSDSEKGDIAVRLAAVQKQYEDEKKKVESLLKGEEKWMKSMSSEKKTIKAMEEELAATQEKLEELQTDYENKLTEKDESEKVVKDELNKLNREKQVLQKKLTEFETSNAELEDEIEHCKISESRMFHRLQQLNTQNEELELKLSKLIKILPNSVESKRDNNDAASHLMSENPEVVPENPLTSSIFTEKELVYLRSKTPELDLLGSVPLDMLRKMKDFDHREQSYQSKVHDLENKNIKLQRNLKILQNKDKDLKHEIKELQLELLKFRANKSKLRASSSSLDNERSGSEDGVESDNQSVEDVDENLDLFKIDDTMDTNYDNMTEEELLLSVKLLNEKQNQDMKRISELELKTSEMEEEATDLKKERSKLQEIVDKMMKAVAIDNLQDFGVKIEAVKSAVGTEVSSILFMFK